MSLNLQKYLPVFECVSKIKRREDRKVVLSILAKEPNFIKALEEIAVNTVEGNIKLAKSQKTSLKKHKELLVQLSEKRGKKLLSQSGGGFLPILIPLVADLIGSLING